MSLFVFASAKGAPGVTTTVLAVAAVWPTGRRVLVAECDPDGGDIAAWSRLAASPGLVSCAAHGRQRLTSAAVTEHVQRLPTDGSGEGGVGVLVAPPSAEQANAAVAAAAAAGAGEVFATLDGVDVLADVGRLRPDSPALPLISHAATTVIVLRPQVAQIAHARSRIAGLAASCSPALLPIGDRPYDAHDVTTALGIPVAGVVGDDRRAAAALAGRGGGRALRRSSLLRSAAAVADQLASLAAQATTTRRSDGEANTAMSDDAGAWS